MPAMINGFFPGTLVPDASIAGCIDVFENVWPDPQKTIETVERECSIKESGSYWTQAETIGAGAYQDARTNKLLPVSYLAQISNNALLQNIHNQFNMILLASTISYGQRYGIHDPLWHENYSLLRYQSGQEYKAHYDGGSSYVSRIVSAVCYLNDDYEGGEIEFPYFKVKIKPLPGMLILFPSNFAYTHIARPVTNGIKYNLVTWLRDQRP